eukprot:COSAG06_NODE_11981_length_1439_cov_12.454478_1_plen_79_part_10
MGGQRKSRRRFSIISALSWSRRNFSAASAVRLLLPFLPSNSLVAHVNADSPHDVCRLSTCLARETALLLLPALCSLLSA